LQKVIDIFLTRSVDEIIQEFNVNNVMSNKQVRSTFQFLADVASGKVPTMATVIRKIIKGHPLYKGDSILSDVAF
jgi:hypothetical protein